MAKKSKQKNVSSGAQNSASAQGSTQEVKANDAGAQTAKGKKNRLFEFD